MKKFLIGGAILATIVACALLVTTKTTHAAPVAGQQLLISTNTTTAVVNGDVVVTTTKTYNLVPYEALLNSQIKNLQAQEVSAPANLAKQVTADQATLSSL